MGSVEAYGEPAESMGICAGAWGCGSHGNVWENSAGIWGKPRRCVGTADMEGSACAWGPPACMGNGNPVKAGNMKAGVRPADFADFWQHQEGGSWVWGSLVHRSYASEHSGSALASNLDIRSLSQHYPAADCI